MCKTALFQVDFKCSLHLIHISALLELEDEHFFWYCRTSLPLPAPSIFPSFPSFQLKKIWNRNLSTLFWAQVVIKP